MIFSAPRFIVVDDDEKHLLAITKTFQALGTACMGIHYDPARELKQDHFRAVRCLFMDLHLVDGQASTDHRRHYGLIASILEDNISKNGGPFILVIWTQHEHLCVELRDYLNQRLDPEKAHAHPLAVLSLAKERFINVGDGNLSNPDELRNAVLAVIIANPQLASLLSWEVDVLAAAADTLASLLNLVPADQRTSKAFPEALDKLLSRLARETVGRPHVDINPRAAIAAALAPILADRILNQDLAESEQEIWMHAVTRHTDRSLEDASLNEAGEINRMLHVAVPGAETIRPTDWGAVVEWPFEWTDDKLALWTDLTIKQMLCEEFRLRSSAIASCRAVLVRVGAACDHAQNNRGPINYLFGVEIPEDAERQIDGKTKQPVKLSDAIWASPVFLASGETRPSRLHVHIRFPLTLLRSACTQWTSVYRLREQLLMHLINTASNYAARPGIVQLPVKSS